VKQVNKINGKTYIGSSIDLRVRFYSEAKGIFKIFFLRPRAKIGDFRKPCGFKIFEMLTHFNFSHISRDDRGNSLIHKALLKYGYSSFSLNILEFIDLNELDLRSKVFKKMRAFIRTRALGALFRFAALPRIPGRILKNLSRRNNISCFFSKNIYYYIFRIF
jgi:hypothetical protein